MLCIQDTRLILLQLLMQPCDVTHELSRDLWRHHYVIVTSLAGMTHRLTAVLALVRQYTCPLMYAYIVCNVHCSHWPISDHRGHGYHQQERCHRFERVRYNTANTVSWKNHLTLIRSLITMLCLASVNRFESRFLYPTRRALRSRLDAKIFLGGGGVRRTTPKYVSDVAYTLLYSGMNAYINIRFSLNIVHLSYTLCCRFLGALWENFINKSSLVTRGRLKMGDRKWGTTCRQGRKIPVIVERLILRDVLSPI